MIISPWLLNEYKKKFGNDIKILEHKEGSTWNDGGSWYTTILKTSDKIIRVHMPSNYQTDKLEITKMKAVMKEVYISD